MTGGYDYFYDLATDGRIAICKVPLKFRDDDMIKACVDHPGSKLSAVPEEMRTFEVCMLYAEACKAHPRDYDHLDSDEIDRLNDALCS
jgi:hypothetical protein